MFRGVHDGYTFSRGGGARRFRAAERGRAGLLLAYSLFVLVPIGLTLLVLRLGAHMDRTTPKAMPAVPHVAVGQFSLAVLTLQVVVIVGVARLMGTALVRCGQPRVVGEIVGGILLGPLLLGRVAPHVAATIFPPTSMAFVDALAQFGLLLFMFVVGLELDLEFLRRRAYAAIFVGHVSMAAPFLLGVLLSLAIYRGFAPAGVAFIPFALFLGAALSVTAFPVLARILAERRMTGTLLGSFAMACAAVNDVTAWWVLAIIAMVTRADDASALLVTLTGTAVYLLIMLFCCRPLLRRLIASHEDAASAPSDSVFAVVVLVALVSAWATERLGIHGAFGACLAGTLLPHNHPFVRVVSERLRGTVGALLLPLYFASMGTRFSIATISGGAALLTCASILIAAILGKLGGTAFAGRVIGMRWRTALSLGALMNTRGLMELVILSIGLELGVLTPTLFAMMVLMALVTTAMTMPVLNRCSSVALDVFLADGIEPCDEPAALH